MAFWKMRLGKLFFGGIDLGVRRSGKAGKL